MDFEWIADFPLLKEFLGVLGNICANTYESKLFTAAYSLFFYAFLRVGEIVLTKGNDSLSVLSINDVSMKNTQLAIVVKSSKTDRLGKGVTILRTGFSYLSSKVYVRFSACQTTDIQSFVLSLWGKTFDEVSVFCSVG